MKWNEMNREYLSLCAFVYLYNFHIKIHFWKVAMNSTDQIYQMRLVPFWAYEKANKTIDGGQFSWAARIIL